MISPKGTDTKGTPLKRSVNGGWVKREQGSERLISVGTDKGETRASRASEASVKEASSRQSAALKRLADR